MNPPTHRKADPPEHDPPPSDSTLSERTLSERALHLGVMAKYWQPARVKTRLGATVGMEQAAKLHQTFCNHLAKTLAGSADRRSFVITPEQRKSDFETMLPAGWQIEFQSGGDLGDRMRRWFETPPLSDRILIGADCPIVDDATVRDAQGLLQAHDVVLGPALDGGYYLIGLRAGWRTEYAGLFEDMHWSSDTVFETTVQRIRNGGLTLATLQPLEDVDTIDELNRLRMRLRDSGSETTKQVLLQTIEQVLAEQVDR